MSGPGARALPDLLARRDAVVAELQGEWPPLGDRRQILRRAARASAGLTLGLMIPMVFAVLWKSPPDDDARSLTRARMAAVIGGACLAFCGVIFAVFSAYGLWHGRRCSTHVTGDLLVVDRGRGFVKERILLSCLTGVERVDGAGMGTYIFRTSRFMNTPTLTPDWIRDGDRLIALLSELARLNLDIEPDDPASKPRVVGTPVA